MTSTRAIFRARATVRSTRILGAGGGAESGCGDKAEARHDEADTTQLVQRRDSHRDLAAVSASDVTRSAIAFRMGWLRTQCIVTAPSVVMRTSNGPITARHPDGEAAASLAAASAAETDRQHAAVGVSLPYVKALLLAECSICSSIAGPRTRRDLRATINGL